MELVRTSFSINTQLLTCLALSGPSRRCLTTLHPWTTLWLLLWSKSFRRPSFQLPWLWTCRCHKCMPLPVILHRWYSPQICHWYLWPCLRQCWPGMNRKACGLTLSSFLHGLRMASTTISVLCWCYVCSWMLLHALLRTTWSCVLPAWFHAWRGILPSWCAILSTPWIRVDTLLHGMFAGLGHPSVTCDFSQRSAQHLEQWSSSFSLNLLLVPPPTGCAIPSLPDSCCSIPSLSGLQSHYSGRILCHPAYQEGL